MLTAITTTAALVAVVALATLRVDARLAHLPLSSSIIELGWVVFGVGFTILLLVGIFSPVLHPESLPDVLLGVMLAVVLGLTAALLAGFVKRHRAGYTTHPALTSTATLVGGPMLGALVMAALADLLGPSEFGNGVGVGIGISVALATILTGLCLAIRSLSRQDYHYNLSKVLAHERAAAHRGGPEAL